jgi:hypothetical protein
VSTPESSDSPLSADEFVEELRKLAARIPDVAPLTPRERLLARRDARQSEAVVLNSLDLMAFSDTIAAAVGTRPGEGVAIVMDRRRWKSVELELRGMLSLITDANLVRGQRVAVMATKAYLIAQQLARNPEGAYLRTHLDEIKRLRALDRKRKKKPAGESAKPEPESQ